MPEDAGCMHRQLASRKLYTIVIMYPPSIGAFTPVAVYRARRLLLWVLTGYGTPLALGTKAGKLPSESPGGRDIDLGRLP